MKKESITSISARPQREEYGSPDIDVMSDEPVQPSPALEPGPSVDNPGPDSGGSVTVNYAQVFNLARQILVGSDFPWTKVSKLKKLFQLK